MSIHSVAVLAYWYQGYRRAIKPELSPTTAGAQAEIKDEAIDMGDDPEHNRHLLALAR